MSLSQSLQNLAYDLDDVLDRRCAHREKIKMFRRKINSALMNAATADLDHGTSAYQEAKQCIDDACQDIRAVTEDLSRTNKFIERLAKVVAAVEKLL
jgi:ElaB/YqjD/DUF883 family membrane-anchored ribosome-binding protein